MDFFDEVIAPSLQADADREVLRTGFNEYVAKTGEEYTSGLRKNKDTILEEKKAIANQLKETQDRYSFLEGKDIDSEKFNSMISQLETYKSSANKDEEAFRQQLTSQYEQGKNAMQEQLNPTINSMKMQLEETSKAKELYQNKYKDYLSENELRKAVSDIGVEADPFWFAGFRSTSKIEYGEDGIKDINVLHDGGYIPLQDWKKVFPNTDRGKKMIKAPVNGGGGASGSGVVGGGAGSLDDISNIADPKARRMALKTYMDKNK